MCIRDRSNWLIKRGVKKNQAQDYVTSLYLALSEYAVLNSKKDLLNRNRALYAPTNKQKGNKKILKFIKLRSSKKHFSKVYRKNK